MTEPPPAARPLPNYRVDVHDGTNQLAARRFFYAPDHATATDKAIATVVDTAGPDSGRYGRLYIDSGARADYIRTVTADDSPAARYERFLAVVRAALTDGISPGAAQSRLMAEGVAPTLAELHRWIDRAIDAGDVVFAPGGVGERLYAAGSYRCTSGDGCPVHPDRGQVHAPDVDARSGAVQLAITVGTADRVAFLAAVADAFGVVIVPRPPVLALDATAAEVLNAHGYAGRWERFAAAMAAQTGAEATTYPLGARYIEHIDVADRSAYTPDVLAMLGDVQQAPVGNTVLYGGLYERGEGHVQSFRLVLTPAERDRLRADLDAHDRPRLATPTSPAAAPAAPGATGHTTRITGPDGAGQWGWECSGNHADCRYAASAGYDGQDGAVASARLHGPLAADEGVAVADADGG